MDTNSNYIPFGDEWKQQVSKMKKADIIEMYATSQRINQKRTAEKNALENWIEAKIKSIEKDEDFTRYEPMMSENDPAISYVKIHQEYKTLKGILKIIEV